MARGKAGGAKYGRPIVVPHEVIVQAKARIAQGEQIGVVAKSIGMHRNGLGKRLKQLGLATTIDAEASVSASTPETAKV